MISLQKLELQVPNFSYNGKGYVMSGDGDDHEPLDSGELWEYNPISDTWSQLASSSGRSSFSR